MKSKFFLPALTAAVGFAIAWVAKPASPGVTMAQQSEETAPKRQNREESGNPAKQGDSKRPKDVNASDFPLADSAEQGPKSRDEARMLRLTEALGLSVDQQGEIIRLIEEVQAATDGNVPVIQDLATRGNAIQEGLAKLLTPEQLAKFQELRVRERDNLIESRAQKMVIGAIEEIDLSPAQREEVLERLRQKVRADMQAIPAVATLLFDKSMLPTNNKELSLDGILILSKISEEGDPLEDPAKAQQNVLAKNRSELEETLKCFDGILSGAQMGQYQAALSESRNVMKTFQDKASKAQAAVQTPASKPAPSLRPVPDPEVHIERVPDDDPSTSTEDESEAGLMEDDSDDSADTPLLSDE